MSRTTPVVAHTAVFPSELSPAAGDNSKGGGEALPEVMQLHPPIPRRVKDAKCELIKPSGAEIDSREILKCVLNLCNRKHQGGGSRL
jgi:hypothetical protein